MANYLVAARWNMSATCINGRPYNYVTDIKLVNVSAADMWDKFKKIGKWDSTNTHPL